MNGSWWFLHGWWMTGWAISRGIQWDFTSPKVGSLAISKINKTWVAWIPHKHSPLSKSSQFHAVSTPLQTDGLEKKRIYKTQTFHLSYHLQLTTLQFEVADVCGHSYADFIVSVTHSHLLVHRSCEGHARLFHGLLAQHLSCLWKHRDGSQRLCKADNTSLSCVIRWDQTSLHLGFSASSLNIIKS